MNINQCSAGIAACLYSNFDSQLRRYASSMTRPSLMLFFCRKDDTQTVLVGHAEDLSFLMTLLAWPTST